MTFPLVSLDRGLRADCDIVEVDRLDQIFPEDLSAPLCPRGAGLSYVAASFAPGGMSVALTRMDRILGFDADAQWIDVEAGTSMGKLYHFLTHRGLRLPVQPGYPAITVGGCIAGNVHGKNHPREGVFGRHVASLELLHPRHGKLRCSREENPEIFRLTIGGLGLTGVILSARLMLVPLEGSAVTQSHIPIGSLEEAFRELPRLRDSADMLYAWMDLSNPKSAGRGFIAVAHMTGAPASLPDAGALPPARLDPNTREWRRRRIFSRQTLPWINRLYRWKALQGAAKVTPLHTFLFPALGKESYFHLFGEAGFFEQQTLIPATAVDSWLPEFRRILAKHDVPVALTTLKLFAGGHREMLHYDGDGFSFAIDVAAGADARALLDELDQLNIAMGAATCVIKDSRLSAATVRQQYPDYERFRSELRAFDPERLFVSALSQRLEL